MTTFDGSTGAHAHFDLGDEPTALAIEPDVDTLELLRQAAADAQEEVEPTIVDIPPGNAIRLVCSTDLTSATLNRWQRKALPQRLRNSSKISPLDVEQSVLYATVLTNMCERVEVWHATSTTWQVIQDKEGRPMTFRDQPLLQALHAIDTQAALKKLFPRDADLIRAGQLVLTKAGWGDEDESTDGDDADPR